MFDIKAVKCYYNDKEGATDRRLAWYIVSYKNNRQSLPDQGGYFCVLLLLFNPTE